MFGADLALVLTLGVAAGAVGAVWGGRWRRSRQDVRNWRTLFDSSPIPMYAYNLDTELLQKRANVYEDHRKDDDRKDLEADFLPACPSELYWGLPADHSFIDMLDTIFRALLQSGSRGAGLNSR